MTRTTESLKVLQKKFLQKWSPDKLKRLTLREYALGGKNSKSTFSYWIETETSSLGSISGIGGGGAFRFGIFVQKNKTKYSKKSRYTSDGTYAWIQNLGSTPEEAFKRIKEDVLKIVEFTRRKEYNRIDEATALFDTARWKIAYLYSNGDLSPIFSLYLLRNVAKHLKMLNVNKATRSELQAHITKYRFKEYKGLDVFEFSDIMWKKFGRGKNINISNNDPEIPEGIEGKKRSKLKLHLFKERDSKFRRKYRKLNKHIDKCPACKFTSNKKYGIEDANRFLELHHIVPLQHIKKQHKITVEGVTLLCPNCHRAIHRLMIEEEKRTISLNEFIKRIR